MSDRELQESELLAQAKALAARKGCEIVLSDMRLTGGYVRLTDAPVDKPCTARMVCPAGAELGQATTVIEHSGATRAEALRKLLDRCC